MKHSYVYLLFITVAVLSFANDGGYYRTTEITPISISNVSIEYERIIFTEMGGEIKADVEIQLFNQDKDQEYLLGFEYPQSTFSAGEHDSSINEHILLVNNKPIKYEYHLDAQRGIGILLYKAFLKNGKNTLYHQYHIQAGFGEDVGHYKYILTTGARWKGNIIKELEVYIHTSNGISFKENSINDFTIVGYGKRNGDSYYLKNGYLYAHYRNYIPDKNIEFYNRVVNYLYRASESGPPSLQVPWMERDLNNQEYSVFVDTCVYLIENKVYSDKNDPAWYARMKDVLLRMNKEQLRILRNTVFARKGYYFSDPKLLDYFWKKIWYLPNPNVSSDSIVFTESEKQFISIIQEVEKSK